MESFGRERKKIANHEGEANGEAYRLTAIKFHERGDLANAESNYIKALKSGNKHYTIFANLGILYRKSGRPDEAIALYKKAIEINPFDPFTYYNLGNLLKDLGKIDQAFASILKSLELKPDYHAAHISMARIYKDLGKFDQALSSNLKSLELKPDNPDAYMNLGGIYKELGELDHALSSTLKSLELKPDNPGALCNLSIIYKDLGKHDLALASILKSLELKPRNNKYLDCLGSIYKSLGAKLFDRQEIDGAIEILRKQLKEGKMGKRMAWKYEVSLNACLNSKAFPRDGTPHTINRETIILCNRKVEDDLLLELEKLRFKKLGSINREDPRYGNGYCTNYNLFEITTPTILQLEKDLREISKEYLNMQISSFKYESFYNVYSSGAGIKRHSHLGIEDNEFNIGRYKYSLVYYLDVGDQTSSNPGILQFYDPDVEFIPQKGMILIFPASRFHSSFYDGLKKRLMVGVNFYAFPTLSTH